MILVLAGTKDGRDLITLLHSAGCKIMASVFSDYGRQLIELDQGSIHAGPLDADGFVNIITSNDISMVVDASHPYAVNVSQNAMLACQTTGIYYLRYERPTAPLPVYEGLHVVHDYDQAVEIAASLGKVVFLTTGSRHLKLFKKATCMENHSIIARVLPEPSVLQECLDLGFSPKDIVAMQGPFSHELNIALFKEYSAEVIVTKNSGQVGGSDTKMTAAMALGLPLVIIDRPVIHYNQIVYTMDDVIKFVKETKIMKYITDPMAIEERSMEIIAPHLANLNLSPEAVKVFSRIIHAAGDPDYSKVIEIHPEAIQAGCAALAAGCDIFCDVEMVRTGINKTRLAEFGGTVHCLIGDEQVAITAKELGITRSMVAMRTFGEKLHGSIVAIGNAPTALFELLNMMKATNIRPALIIGVPVGFVGAAESKDFLAQASPVPYITVRGNKGGSPIAAATTNALLYMYKR